MKKDKKNEAFKHRKIGKRLNVNLTEREEMRKYYIWQSNRNVWERELDR